MPRILASLAVAALTAAAPAAAQERSPGSQPGVSVGLGVGIEPLATLGITSAGNLNGTVNGSGFAPVGLYVPIQVNPQIRIEPVIGFWHVSGSRNAASDGQQIGGSATTLGVGGLLYLAPPAPTGFYAGLRLALNLQSADVAAAGGTTTTSKETDFSLAPVFGGEYAFAPRFTLGAEFQLPFTWYGNPTSETAGASVTSNNDRSGFRTNAVVFLRYFFL
ncbi:MAG TPA: outer membrane beta-barrel protein [Anaeromyxobacteraceae bacterium]|nr:outer membrane beta-barrel protein [Anaeromyxobacteraceae bacterium]